MIKPVPLSFDDLLALRRTWPSGTQVVFTNGIFDLIHIGHLRYLEQARALGDLLIIGLNSDASTRQLKGPQRPLVTEVERAALLLGLRAVDYVTIFDDLTAERVVDILRPDIYVKGGDYALPTAGETMGQGKRLPEARTVLGYGGRVQLIPYLPGHSTSELIARIVERYGR